MSRYPNEGVERFDQQFAETEDERNDRLAARRRAAVGAHCSVGHALNLWRGVCGHHWMMKEEAAGCPVCAIRAVRSLIHNLPRSATADKIDEICADALGEPRTP